MAGLMQNPMLLPVLCGAAAFAVVVLIWTGLIEQGPLQDRLKAISDRREELENPNKNKKNTRRASLQRVSLMKRIVEWLKLSRGESLNELRLKLRRAGYPSRDAMFVFLFVKIALALGLAAGSGFFLLVLKLGGMSADIGLLVVIFVGVLGFLLPEVFIKNKIQSREEVLRKGVPDALDLLVICAEAGLGLDASFDRVAREIAASYPELAEEIGVTGVELNFLPDRHKALHGLSDRVPLPGVIALVNTLIQTEKYGTPLAQALRVLSAEMREERMMKAEEKAARLPAILTVPMILFILPPLFIVLIGPAALKVMSSISGAKG